MDTTFQRTTVCVKDAFIEREKDMANVQFSPDPAIAEKQALKSMNRKKAKIDFTLFCMFFVGAPSFSIVAAIDQSRRDFETLTPVAEWLKSSGRPQVAQRLEDMLRGLQIGRNYTEKRYVPHQPQIHTSIPHAPTWSNGHDPMTDAIRSSTEYAQNVFYQTSENFDRMIRGQD